MQERKGMKAVGYFNSFHSAAPLWLHFGTYSASVSCSRIWNPNTFQRSKQVHWQWVCFSYLPLTHSLGVGYSLQGPWTVEVEDNSFK